jgi:dipeptidyl aminopeptidase/acylaminoacyl peptidase
MKNIRCPGKFWLRSTLVVSAIWLLANVSSHAQEIGQSKAIALADEKYQAPSKEIADVVLADWHKNVTLNNLSPDGKKFLITKNDGLPTADRQGRPCIYLGELAFDPIAHRAHPLYVKSSAGFDLFDHASKRTVPLQVPAKARVSHPAWSPDGSQLAFFAHFPEATYVYIANARTGQTRKLTDTPVLTTFVQSIQWTKDGTRVQAVLLPDDGARKLPAEGVADGPKVRVSLEGRFPTRTYRFLLEKPHDMEMLEHLATGQLAFIDVYDGKVKKVGAPNMFRTAAMAPSGEQFLVTLMKKPFSYYAPASSFGSQEGLWDLAGKNLHTIADRDLRIVKGPAGGGKGPAGGGKGQPKKGGNLTATPDGKRDLAWRPDGKGMSFLMLEPAPAVADRKVLNDRVMQWLPPFGKNDVAVVYETPQRITSVHYSDDCQWLFMSQTADKQRQIVAVNLKEPKTTYVIHKGVAAALPEKKDTGDGVDKGDGEDEPTSAFGGAEDSPFTPIDEEFPFQGYDHEQQPKGKFGAGQAAAPILLTRAARGEGKVVRISSAGDVYIAGTTRNASAPYPRAYIDKVAIKAGKAERLFLGRGDLLETIDTVDADDLKFVFTTRQKKDVVPDCYRHNLATGNVEKLTDNADRTPGFHKRMQTQRIQVTRKDGFKFWVKVTLPSGAKAKLPAMFWIYPKEYTSQADYNSKTGGGGGKGGAGGADAGRFTAPGIRSMSLLTLLGYAVIEPDVPIVGQAGKMNDNYIADLKSSLKAVVEELVKRDLVDRERLAIGGHSYGAFSTANAMVHTTYFKAGIAGDGCYNRTLTPMTFQTEKRTLWTARQTYLDMSPLLQADRMTGALLIYHGMDDANVGTNPMNAEHLYMALRGLGKPAALYMYPYEGHGPAGRQTILDQWARWTTWLDMHVMNPAKK